MQMPEIINLSLIFIGIVLILAEVVIGLDTMFDLVLSGSALFLGGVFGLVFSANWIVGLIFSITLLAFYWLAGRVFLHRKLQKPIHFTNIDRIVGKKVKLGGRLSSGNYTIKIEGEIWPVYSDLELEQDQEVEVVEVHGNQLKVQPINS